MNPTKLKTSRTNLIRRIRSLCALLDEEHKSTGISVPRANVHLRDSLRVEGIDFAMSEYTIHLVPIDCFKMSGRQKFDWRQLPLHC